MGYFWHGFWSISDLKSAPVLTHFWVFVTAWSCNLPCTFRCVVGGKAARQDWFFEDQPAPILDISRAFVQLVTFVRVAIDLTTLQGGRNWMWSLRVINVTWRYHRFDTLLGSRSGWTYPIQKHKYLVFRQILIVKSIFLTFAFKICTLIWKFKNNLSW